MMNKPEKSDSPVVAMKSANKAGQPAAESMERRGGTKGNMVESPACRTRSRGSATAGLDRVRQAARENKDERFTALLHHVDVDLLRTAFNWLQRKAAPGVDGLTWRDYEIGLEGRLADLHTRIHRGSYRALPSRRQYIPKSDGRQRPLGIAALEDKIVQRAVVEVLNAIYEPDFLGFSYGFRPGRSQHDALDALATGIVRTPVKWILDCDVRAFFDSVNHDWMLRFVEHRIGDPRIVRLIRQWLKAGVLEDGRLQVSEEGTPQGAVVSPLLANIYLHYVFDLWADRWRRQRTAGNIVIVRYADDQIIGFEREADARQFLADLELRLQKFGLALHPDKTRLIEFGRYAAGTRARRRQGKPQTFAFLGFTHICGKSRRGNFLLLRFTRRDRMLAKLREIKEALRHRMHDPIPKQGAWLQQVVRGYFAYHAVPTNFARLSAFRHHVVQLWQRALSRRSQKGRVLWERIYRLAADWLPLPRILHPWPLDRFAVKHPRWEPGA
jgi:group II intron reverse transcriptase/maturase